MPETNFVVIMKEWKIYKNTITYKEDKNETD
jgi:hypothetical protein